MDEWEISKPLGQCFGCDKKIESGEEYFAALVESEKGMERRDFCSEYWQKEKPAVYCYWKSKLPDPTVKKQLFVDDDMLVSFFERLANETEQEKVNFRYVLALILMRKRLLKYESSKRENEKDIWQLRVVGENRFVEVEHPNLDENQMAALSEQLRQILHVEI